MKRFLFLAVAAALLPACGSGSSSSAPPPQPMPDFNLLDGNTASPTYNTSFSPRTFLGLVPAFYFGHAT